MNAHHDDEATAPKVEITVNDEGYIRANGFQIGWVAGGGLPLLRAALAAGVREAPPTPQVSDKVRTAGGLVGWLHIAPTAILRMDDGSTQAVAGGGLRLVRGPEAAEDGGT